MEYKCISVRQQEVGREPEKFNLAVQAMLDAEWKLYGEHKVVSHGSSLHYSQSFTREENEDGNKS